MYNLDIPGSKQFGGKGMKTVNIVEMFIYVLRVLNNLLFDCCHGTVIFSCLRKSAEFLKKWKKIPKTSSEPN